MPEVKNHYHSELFSLLNFISDIRCTPTQSGASRESIKEYLDVDFAEAEAAMGKTTIGIYTIKHEGGDNTDPPEDVGIIVEGVTVLNNIDNIACATALLFGVIYVLNLSYPSDFRYTFEFFQKVLMKIDDRRLSDKVQVLKNKLCG